MPNKQFCFPNVICVNYYFIISILLVVLTYIFLSTRKSKIVYIDTAKKSREQLPQYQRPDLYRKVDDKLNGGGDLVNVQTISGVVKLDTGKN